jgi:hypothetical protein
MCIRRNDWHSARSIAHILKMSLPSSIYRQPRVPKAYNSGSKTQSPHHEYPHYETSPSYHRRVQHHGHGHYETSPAHGGHAQHYGHEASPAPTGQAQYHGHEHYNTSSTPFGQAQYHGHAHRETSPLLHGDARFNASPAYGGHTQYEQSRSSRRQSAQGKDSYRSASFTQNIPGSEHNLHRNGGDFSSYHDQVPRSQGTKLVDNIFSDLAYGANLLESRINQEIGHAVQAHNRSRARRMSDSLGSSSPPVPSPGFIKYAGAMPQPYSSSVVTRHHKNQDQGDSVRKRLSSVQPTNSRGVFSRSIIRPDD